MPVPAFRCPICGSTLVRRDERAACTYCGAEDGSYGRGGLAPWRCPEGHWLCEDCRTAAAKDLPGRVVGSLGGKDPFALAELLMAHPAMRQETYGPDFHAIPPLSLLIALRNAGAWKGSEARILAAVRRGVAMGSGSCYLSGACGACVGAGAAASAVLALDIESEDRGLALGAVSAALGRLARTGGRRCCAEAVYAALEGALEILGDRLEAAAAMRRERIVCSFSASKPDCKGERCPYHPAAGGGEAESGA